jgi:hypothetical protein
VNSLQSREVFKLGKIAFVMTPEERERMNVLVLLIQKEKDHGKFTKLVDELNKLIAQKEDRFPHEKPK